MSLDKNRYLAWDKRAKRMFDTPFHVLGEVTCFNLLEQWVMEQPFELTSLQRMQDLVLRQSTGLVNELGKEIFEGAIISFDGELGVVVYTSNSFVVRFKGSILDDYFPSWNIVGNIYENPELVEGFDYTVVTN